MAKITRRNITVQMTDNVLHALIDSRLVAKRLGIEHKVLKQRIRRQSIKDCDFTPIKASETEAISFTLASESDTDRAGLSVDPRPVSTAGGRGNEVYYLLKFGEVQLLAAMGRTAEARSTWHAMQASLERAMESASRTALKSHHTGATRALIHPQLNDCLNDKLIPYIRACNPDSGLLKDGAAFNVFTVYARLPGLKHRETPWETQTATLIEAAAINCVELGIADERHYKAIYTDCKTMAHKLLDAAGSPHAIC